MTIKENIPLAPYTTFKIGGKARYFCTVLDQFDALEAYEFAEEKKLPVFILAGGSNVLISDSGFAGLVIKIEGRGIEIVKETKKEVLLKVAAGHNWDELVSFAVTNGWWGIENLSHIPGSTGAIAVQNVGAYGQEAGQVLRSVTVFDKQTKQILELPNSECRFGYRSSIFNTTQKNKYLIFYVTLRLLKSGKPNLGYKDLAASSEIQKALGTGAAGVKLLEIIRQQVIQIRNKKFPFPVAAKNGNAGSFFRGPVIAKAVMQKLKRQLAEIFGSQVADRLNHMEAALKVEQGYKTPAAFLIDVCGLKGLAKGGAAVNMAQPAIILNATGKATAQDVVRLAEAVRKKVYTRTGLRLQFEPEFVGFKDSEYKSLML